MGSKADLLARCSRRLLVFVGASGAGKDTVLHAWLATRSAGERPYLARRVITRPDVDKTERHEAADPAQWQALRASGALAFDWSAHGVHYGVRWTELEPLRLGRWVAMNGSRAYLPHLHRSAPLATVVQIDASAPVRLARLRARGREQGPEMQRRLARDVGPVQADFVVDNDGPLDAAVAQLSAWWARQKLD